MASEAAWAWAGQQHAREGGGKGPGEAGLQRWYGWPDTAMLGRVPTTYSGRAGGPRLPQSLSPFCRSSGCQRSWGLGRWGRHVRRGQGGCCLPPLGLSPEQEVLRDGPES